MSVNEATPELVVAARAGDSAAMDALYRRFAPVVHGVLLAYVQKADADDLTQDVFETAIHRLRQLHDPAAFPGWIVRIARRAALTFRRGRSARTDIALERTTAPDTPEQKLDADRALSTILELPVAYRETLLLRLVEGLTGPEIAERTGLAPGSVRVNLHRGMAMLKDALTAPSETPGGNT